MEPVNTPNNFQLVLIQPEEHQHSAALAELAETLLYGLDALGVNFQFAINDLAEDATNIILGAHLLGEQAMSDIPAESIIYNSEQINDESTEINSAYLSLLHRCTVWDYSRHNIQRLQQRGVDHAKYVPIGYVPPLTRIPAVGRQDIDVLFYGAINERRKTVLEALIERGLRIEFLSGVYREERDHYIARAKVVLNMHYYDTSIFEIVRVSYLLANEKAVVAECGDATVLESDIHEAVCAVPYEQLVDACVDLVNDAKKRVGLARRGFEIFVRRNEQHILGDAMGISCARQERGSQPCPTLLNLGSGRDWRENCLNVDINDAVRPDALLDIARPLAANQALETVRFGTVALADNSFDAIFANDVLEHIPDLKTAMGNCLRLLKPGGTFHIHVPYELSTGAWRDPTHVRAFNEESWVYYTDWFWYMDWTEARFELLNLEFQLSALGGELRTAGQSIKEILRTPRAVDGMSAILRKRYLLESEIAKSAEFVRREQSYNNEPNESGRTATASPSPIRESAPPSTMRISPHLGTPAKGNYARWLEIKSLDELGAQIFQEHADRLWKKRQLFEFILVLRPGEDSLLADSIDSIAQQYYEGWRLTILAEKPSPEIEFTQDGSPVRWLQIPGNMQRADFIDEWLNRTSASWIGFFPCGTRFAPQLLLVLADYIAIRPEWRLVYSDEDTVDANQLADNPQFKPDFNLELLRSTDYIGGFFIEKKALLSAGGYSRIRGAETYDTILRLADAGGEQRIGHIADVLCHLPKNSRLRTEENGAMQSLREHFARRRIGAEIEAGNIAGVTRRVRYRHTATPKVSIIVPTRNRLELLGPCVESLLKKTRYPDWELLIVDNGSDDANVTAYYETLCSALPDKVRVLRYDAPFNYSAMNNLAACSARGEYLLLLNNDTECIHDDWLDAMMCHAQRPDAGIVGARLLFPDSLKVQHAGVILGMTGTAGHVSVGSLSHDEPGYLNRAQVDQEYSAVTGACLLIRKTLFEELGGLDENDFGVSFNDIDLCLKLRQKGYRVIWTPFATLLHHGSATQLDSMAPQKRSAFQREAKQFYLRWEEELSNDPAWNRNLCINSTDPVVEDDLIAPWDTDFHDRPRILVMPSTTQGIAEYRNLAPLRALRAEGRIQYAAACQPRKDYERAPMPTELKRLAPDTLFMNTPVDNLRCQALLNYPHFNSDIFRVYTLDDLITHLPTGNPNHKTLPADVMKERLALGLKASHRLIVSTEPLADAYRHLIDDIRIVPNSLPWPLWGHLQPQRHRGKKMRVGWAGAQQHAGDLQFVQKIVKATHREVDWIFFGMLLEEMRPYIAEFHDYVHDFFAYPAKLASLDLDLAIAPLENHPFNEAKSNLRLLEYGILGWPVVCTDIFPYRTDNPPVTRLPNDPDKWIAAIREKIAEPQALAREGDALRDWVKRHYLLENRLDQWFAALTR